MATPRDPIRPSAVPTEDAKSEQEKDNASEVKGVGPAAKAEKGPGPVETIEEQGIGPRDPYPTKGD